MIIGVDVGGTFTDIFFLDEASQKIEIAKVPSSPEDSSRGFLKGLGTHAKDWSRGSDGGARNHCRHQCPAEPKGCKNRNPDDQRIPRCS